MLQGNKPEIFLQADSVLKVTVAITGILEKQKSQYRVSELKKFGIPIDFLHLELHKKY